MNFLADSYASFVNLDSRTDRLRHMQAQLATLNIQAVRTRGMLPYEYVGPSDKIKCMLSRPQKGAIGCHFSQVAVMQEALKQGKNAFVMEDDLIFCSDFHKRMEIVNAYFETHPQWDVLWLGGTFHVNPPWWHKGRGRDCEVTSNPRIVRTYGAFSTHAYVVNKHSIQRILKSIEEILPLSMGIDWAFIQLQPQLYAYAFVPGCVIQYDNQSNIGKGLTIFSNFKKLGPYWFQDKMEQFDPTTFNWHEADPHKIYPQTT